MKSTSTAFSAGLEKFIVFRYYCIMKKPNLSLSLPVAVLREGRQFIAYTPALDFSTSGKSHQQALARFHEAVNLFVEECMRRGTLDAAVHDLGWRKARHIWRSPVLVSHEMRTVSAAV